MKKLIFICLAAVTVYMNTAAQGINFIEGKPFAEVKALAKAEGKLIFVDCYTSWCGPCKMMATKEFVKKEAGDYFNKKFVNYKIDMEKGEGPEIGKQYNVSVFPTFLILESNGDLRGRAVGTANITDFIKKIEDVLNNEKGYLWYQKKFNEGERNDSFLMDYAKILKDIHMSEELKNVTTILLKRKSSHEIAANKKLYSAFADGGFTPNDDIFLAVYKERQTVEENQGERAVRILDALWSQQALDCLKFDGMTYLGFDEEAHEAYKQKMIEYGVPGADDIVKTILRTKAKCAKDYPTIYQYITEEMKKTDKIDDYFLINDMQQLVLENKSNKKAMKGIIKYAKQRITQLKKIDTSKEREIEYNGKKFTNTSYLIDQYQNIIRQVSQY